MEKIKYRRGYKYLLMEQYTTKLTEIIPPYNIETEFIRLKRDGTLIIEHAYAWDGPSGPTFDTPTFMRGSLVHDALYQLMREEHLDVDEYREAADKVLYRMCLEDGMNKLRAWAVYDAVRLAGRSSAMPSGERLVRTAP